MGMSTGGSYAVILHENSEHNYPASYWTCFDCRSFETVLGSQGGERCPTCQHPMVWLNGLVVSPIGETVIPAQDVDSAHVADPPHPAN